VNRKGAGLWIRFPPHSNRLPKCLTGANAEGLRRRWHVRWDRPSIVFIKGATRQVGTRSQLSGYPTYQELGEMPRGG
jgi:hypothetical protein